MFGKRAAVPLILIALSAILFLVNLWNFGSGAEGENGNSLGMVSNLLVIAAMVLVLIGNRKQRGNQSSGQP